MAYFDVVFLKEPDFTESEGHKSYTGLYACQEENLENPAGVLYKKVWHALVTQEQYDAIMNDWPADKRPLNPKACDRKFFREGAGPGNWKCYNAYGPGRDTMTDETEKDDGEE